MAGREYETMKENPIIGSNLYLRKSCFDDCLYFAVWEARPEVSRFFTIDDGRDYQQTVREYIEREKDACAVQWTICAIADDRPVGRIYVSSINKHYDSLDITRIYIADTKDRGRGYGREALELILKWAFDEMDMERVTLDHFADNRIAASLYEKTGFRREGIMRCGGKKNGRYVDLWLMSMLREEFHERQTVK